MRIIIDSGCDFSDEVVSKYDLDIERVPLYLRVNGKEYIDDDDLNIDDFLGEMESSKEGASTAAPGPQSYFDKIKGEGSAFLVTLSQKLSSSYSSACLAKKMYAEELSSKFVHVFDSMSASVGELLVAIRINEHLKNKLADNEIVEKVNDFIRNDLKTYFILEKYDNLVKSGRIAPYIAGIARLMNIKPICGSKDGDIVLKDKARGSKRAFSKLADIIASEKINFEERILAISHVKAVERALEFKDEIIKRVNFKDIIIMDAKGLITSYADKEGIVVAY